MGETEDQAKQYTQVGDLIAEIKRQGEKTPMSAKEEAAATKKLLDTQVEMLKLFEGGIPSDLSSASEKAIMSAAQQAGIDVTEKQEDKSQETERFLIQLAFKAKMERLKEAKVKAKKDGDMAAQAGLGIKGLWLEGTNKISEKILDLKERIASGTDITNMTQAIGQDFSMLTMEFQGLMQLPGMKTIVAGIKFLASWAGKLLWPLILKAWVALKKWLFKRGKQRVAARLFRQTGGKEGEEYQKWYKPLTGLFGAKVKSGGQAAKSSFEGLMEGAKGLMPKKKKIATKDDQLSFPFADIAAEQKKELDKSAKVLDLSKAHGVDFRKGQKNFIHSMKGWFTDKRTKGINLAARAFGKAEFLFRKGLGKVTGAFKKLGKNLLKSAKRMMPIILGFIVNMGIWLVNMAMLIAGFITANIGTIAIIALFVLIAVGIYFLVKYLMDNWEVMKVKWNMGVDRLKLFGAKVGNWFADAADNIGYTVKKFIAIIIDGIAGFVNGAIDWINSMKPDWMPGDSIIPESWKMKTGRVAGVEAEREAALTARDVRDKKLQSDFDANYIERGKQLDAAAKADADRKAKKGAGDGDVQQVNVATHTDAREVIMASESTAVNDPSTVQAAGAFDIG